jgi:hypothetical protein
MTATFTANATLISVFNKEGIYIGSLIRHARGYAAFDASNRGLGSNFETADAGAAAIWRAAHNQKAQP